MEGRVGGINQDCLVSPVPSFISSFFFFFCPLLAFQSAAVSLYLDQCCVPARWECPSILSLLLKSPVVTKNDAKMQIQVCPVTMVRTWQQALVKLLGSSIISLFARWGWVCAPSCGVMRPASRPHSQDILVTINSKLYPCLLLSLCRFTGAE